jgi:transposase InsO family protein
MRMNQIERDSHFKRLQIPSAGVKFYMNALEGPSRSVSEGALFNQTSAIYSEKSDCTIQAESGTGEYAAVFEYEFKDEYLEVLDQLPHQKIKGISKNGRQCTYLVRSDYIVIKKDSVEVHEIKSDEYVQKKIDQKHPAWEMDSDGEVHYWPLEKHFENLGFKYKIRLISSFNKVLLSNSKLILSSRRASPVSNKFRQRVHDIFNNKSFMSMAELMKALKIEDATPILQLIDKKEIFCEIEAEFLSDPDNINIAATRTLSKHARYLKEKSSELLDMVGAEVSCVPPRRHAEEALKKLEILESGIDNRTTQRWRKKIKDGEKDGLSPFECLLPKHSLKGNRTERLSKTVLETFIKSVNAFYANPKRPSIKSALVRYRHFAREAHPDEEPMCESTFRRHLKKLDAMKVAYRRGGKRMMHANSPTTDIELRSLKSRVAFQRAHIDHHLVKCWVTWGADKENVFVGRPLLTILIDEATDNVLAWHFTFAKPSRLIDGCLLRGCVRLHGQLPEEIVADHGSDFKSVYFRSVLASEKVTLTHRPKSCAKSGSEVERIFKEFMIMWLCQREGNMVDKQAVRAVDRNFDAKNFAVMSPEDLICEFEQFINFRNNKLRGSKTVTIEDNFNHSRTLFSCVGRKIEMNTKFLVSTAVEAKEFTIERNDVKIDGIRYSNLMLKNHKIVKAKVDVRIDPENPYLVYAFVKNRWISCVATGIVEFMEKSVINQKIETLKIRGAGSLRALARSASDEKLGYLFDVADKRLSANKMPSTASFIDLDELPNDSIDDNFNYGDREPQYQSTKLPTSAWSQI